MKRIPIKHNILSTYIVSILSSLTVLISFKILAHVLSYNDFLEYMKIIRYLNWFYVLLTLSLGFGIIYLIKQGKNHKRVLSSAVAVIILEFIVAFTILLYEYNEYIFLFFFVAGQVLFHILVSYFRGIQNIRSANILTLVNKTIIPLWVLLFIYMLNIQSYEVYLLSTAIITIAILFTILYKIFDFSTISYALVKQELSFSSSRWLENLLRMSYIVIILILLDYEGMTKLAGEFALIFSLLKFIESLTQPVMMTLFSISKKSKIEKNRLYKKILFFSLVVNLIISLLLYNLSEMILTVLFNENYQYLSEYLFIISLAIFPILAATLIKGIYEEYFKRSPLIIINLIMVMSIAVLPFFDKTLLGLCYFIIVSYWIRLFLFLYNLRLKNVHY